MAQQGRVAEPFPACSQAFPTHLANRGRETGQRKAPWTGSSSNSHPEDSKTGAALSEVKRVM